MKSIGAVVVVGVLLVGGYLLLRPAPPPDVPPPPPYPPGPGPGQGFGAGQLPVPHTGGGGGTPVSQDVLNYIQAGRAALDAILAGLRAGGKVI